MLDEAMEQCRQQGYEAGQRQGLERGQREGYEAGFQETKRKFEAELAQQLQAFAVELQSKVDNLNRALPSFLDDAEEAMADRAVEVVTSLLSHELETSRASAMAIVREVLGEITMARHARIKVNPFDGPLLREGKQQLLLAANSLRDIEILDDPSITAGCIVETETGILDATVDTRFQVFKDSYSEAA